MRALNHCLSTSATLITPQMTLQMKMVEKRYNRYITQAVEILETGTHLIAKDLL